MKCPYCDQEMIDKKEFCVSCGKRLYEEKGVSKKTLLIILGVLILGAVLICYLIINLNTDKEIEPYINKNKENIETKQ